MPSPDKTALTLNAIEVIALDAADQLNLFSRLIARASEAQKAPRRAQLVQAADRHMDTALTYLPELAKRWSSVNAPVTDRMNKARNPVDVLANILASGASKDIPPSMKEGLGGLWEWRGQPVPNSVDVSYVAVTHTPAERHPVCVVRLEDLQRLQLRAAAWQDDVEKAGGTEVAPASMARIEHALNCGRDSRAARLTDAELDQVRAGLERGSEHHGK